jgi:hypothetical protein
MGLAAGAEAEGAFASLPAAGPVPGVGAAAAGPEGMNGLGGVADGDSAGAVVGAGAVTGGAAGICADGADAGVES